MLIVQYDYSGNANGLQVLYLRAFVGFFAQSLAMFHSIKTNVRRVSARLVDSVFGAVSVLY